MNEEQTKQVMDTVNSTNVLVQQMNYDIKRLNTAVLGDDEAGIDGLADRVGKTEGNIDDLHTKMSWAKGVSYAAGLFVAFMAFIKDHIKWA